MTGLTEDAGTCGGLQQLEGMSVGGGEHSPSFTTLSTVAIQAGQSQLVASVLRSGSQVHVQLSHVQPGLCEIGSNLAENQSLIVEQQQLVEKLKKHEREVMAVVENGHRTEQGRTRRDEGTKEPKRNKEEDKEENEVYKAMAASLSEGWSLLRCLLEQRQEVLMLASNFYCQALEFAVSMDTVEDLQIRADPDRRTEEPLLYASVRRDLLRKSLQVLTSSSALLHKIQQLQRAEALQRRGVVLQDEESKESQSFHGSREVVQRLEQLVETLQDRRRRVDQAVRRQLQQVENDVVKPYIRSEQHSYIHLKSKSEFQDLKSGSRFESKSRSPLEGVNNLESRFRLNLRNRCRSDLKLDSKPKETTSPPESIAVRISRSKLQENRYLQPQCTSDVKTKSDENRNFDLESRLEQIPGSASGQTRDGKSAFRSQQTRKLESEPESAKNKDLQPKTSSDETAELHLGSIFDLKHESRSNLKPGSHSNETINVQPRSTSHFQVGSTSEETRAFELKSKLDLKTESRSEDTTDLHLGSSLEIDKLLLDVQTRPKLEMRRGLLSKSTLVESKHLPESRANETKTPQSGTRLNVQRGSGFDLKPVAGSELTKQEVNDLLSHQRMQTQQKQEDMTYCRKYRERLLKDSDSTLQNLNCVSELLDSCTLLDLGSDRHTSRLLECFNQARPHFIQLNKEVECIVRDWESLAGVQDRLKVKEEDLSELLKLQKKVTNKIKQSESILDLTSSFHLTAQQLEALLQSEPATELERHMEKQQLMQGLLQTAVALKTNICAAAAQSDFAGFRLEQLELRLLSLRSACILWLNEAARHEVALSRELLNHRLNDDIDRIHDSLKDLKKKFSNLMSNHLRRNDRNRNMKALRNQLQQVELYEEKLQELRKRLQGAMAWLETKVKDGDMTLESTVSELWRQMGELEQSVSERRKTLDMSCRLQEAMDECQLWYEEARATITRVGKVFSERRSTEAMALLFQQFEAFVWLTVPRQEERISQITELAVRLHGAEEGRRYIEKTVSKHSEMLASIRKLSDGLMELETNLKVTEVNASKQKANDGEMDERRKNKMQEKDGETVNQLKEKREVKRKDEVDKHCSQEAVVMDELKETGHTPELKEVPLKMPAATHEKILFQKICSQEAGSRPLPSNSRQQSHRESTTPSYCSTHTFRLSCSLVEVARRVSAISSQSQLVATDAQPPPLATDLVLCDVLRNYQRREVQETEQQKESAGGLMEMELQQHDVMTEPSLSIDGYECASPDDISLPPLAETPESGLVPSDVEEDNSSSSECVSSSASGPLQQQRDSSQTEGRPTSSISLCSSSRSESSWFVQSSVTVPASGHFCYSADLHLGDTRPTSVCSSNTADISYRHDNVVPESRSLSETKPLLTDLCDQISSDTYDTFPRGSSSLCSSQKTFPQDISLPQSYHQTSNTASSPTMSQRSNVTTTSSVTLQTVFCPSDRHCNVPQADSTFRPEGLVFQRSNKNQPVAPAFPHPDITVSRSTATSSKTQTQIQSLAPQANRHAATPSAPPHGTSDQQPDIGLPTSVCEEIRLPLKNRGSAPHIPQVQTPSLPQGTASQHGPPCDTSPPSGAAITEAPAVTEEAEVTGLPQPTPTWCKDGDVSATSPGRAQDCGDVERSLCISDGGSYEFQAANHQDSQQSLGDKMSDLMSVDWLTWFISLCVLLCLIYLTLL